MKYAPNNPEHNVLGPGVDEDQILSAVLKSGYPLQISIANALRSEQKSKNIKFSIQEEWSYLDRDTNDLRSIDLVAELCMHGWNPQPRVRPQLDLLVECKQSNLPYIFFQDEGRRYLKGFPTIAGLRNDRISITTDDDPSTWTFDVVHALDLNIDPFQISPPVCHTLSKCVRKGADIELSGSEAYNGLVMPLVKAVQHFVNANAPVSTAWYFDCHLALAVAVLDAPMISIVVGSDGPEMNAVPWVRTLRHEYEREGDHFQRDKLRVVDVIHRDFFHLYLSEHVLPFANRFAERVLRHPTELATGMAFVSRMGAESWGAVEDRMRPRTLKSRIGRSTAIGRMARRSFRRWQRED